jgi:hypothetical protein
MYVYIIVVKRHITVCPSESACSIALLARHDSGNSLKNIVWNRLSCSIHNLYPYYMIAIFTRIAFNFIQTCTTAKNIRLKTNGYAKIIVIIPLQKFLTVFSKSAHSTALENKWCTKTAVLNKR